MATDNGSSIWRSKGRPIGNDGRGTMVNPTRRAGGGGLRDAMRGQDVPLRDRVKARNLDNRMAQQEARAASGPGSPTTAPAVGPQLDARRALYSEMEKVGPAGISPEMRQRARTLGVGDEAFNTAAARINTNSKFSPNVAPPAAPSGPAAPQVNAAPPASPVTAATRATTPPMKPASSGDPRVNKETGRVFGNSGYKPLWRKNAAPYRA